MPSVETCCSDPDEDCNRKATSVMSASLCISCPEPCGERMEEREGELSLTDGRRWVSYLKRYTNVRSTLMFQRSKIRGNKLHISSLLQYSLWIQYTKSSFMDMLVSDSTALAIGCKIDKPSFYLDTYRIYKL